MGLFDIFKRRSKKNEEEIKKTAEPAESKQDQDNASTTQENQSTTDEPSKQADADQGSTTTDVDQTQSETPAEPTEPKESQAEEPVQQQPSEPEMPDDSKQAPQSVEPAEPKTVNHESGDRSLTEKVPEESKVAAPEEEPVKDAVEEKPESTTQQYEKGLEKSRSSFGAKLNALLANFRHVDESFFDDLEDMLIESDVGFETSMRIADELRDEVKFQNAKKPKDVQNVIVEKLIDLYDKAGNGENAAINMAKSGPTVILFVGVNGVGKTTTIGKMANMYKQQGKKVVLAAADTFRAGAIEQLNVWAERDGVDIVKGKAKSDPASVVFDAVKKARDENYDVLMVDTAGRLQNKVNLMNELSKMKKILTREIPEAPHEVLLVLDATTGQNAMTQAKMFKEATDVTGIVLTKLDGTARGGIVLAIRSELHLPVKYVGLGEKVTDLKPFDPNDFVYGLFKGLISE